MRLRERPTSPQFAEMTRHFAITHGGGDKRRCAYPEDFADPFTTGPVLSEPGTVTTDVRVKTCPLDVWMMKVID
jgi:hypothetical protein